MDKKEYFNDTDYISNSQLRTFRRYNKYWQKQIFPDDYIAIYIDKTEEFQVNDAIIIWKIVDEFFDWTWDKVWEKYIPVARRSWKDVPDWCMEITLGMQETALKMISRWRHFRKFKVFLQHSKTESQVQLKWEVELTDKLTWEIRKVKLKGLPDYRNEDLKLIVDLKTTWSIDMIIDDLQFRWDVKLTANYISQLAIYNKLSWWDYNWALALVTDDWVKWIDIPNQILLDAWEILERDIIELDNFIKDPTSINESIFQKNEEMVSLEDLSL